MRSSKSSKKSLKKEEEALSAATPVSKAPTTRATRSLTVPKGKVNAVSAEFEGKKDPGPAKVLTAAAGAGPTKGGIVDSVGVMAASPVTDAPVATRAFQLKPAALPEDIAHLAYSYWEARGFTHGMADEDWIRAEAELLARG